MPHRHPHKPAHRVKPKYKKLALIAAAAALLSTTSLPGMPASTVYAAANDMSASTSQQVGRTSDSSNQINAEKTNRHKPPNATKQKNKTPQEKKNTSPTSAPVQKTVEKNKSKKTVPEKKTNSPTTAKSSPENTKKTKPDHPNKASSKEQNLQPKEENKPPTSDNAPTHYKDILDISATAYAPGAHDNEQWGDKTYTGTTVRPGIIAVDPNLIPLGSRVYIEYPDGHGEYAIAEDTGGAIKGNRIDVAKETVNEAQDFGIQKVKVYVITTPKNV